LNNIKLETCRLNNIINFARNKIKTSLLKNLKPDATLPESPNKVLGLIDMFDVPVSKKQLMQEAILNNSKTETKIIFINNETNI